MKDITTQEFLSRVWPNPLLRNETLELRAIRREDKTIKRRFVKSIQDFMREAEAFGPGWEIYFGVSTRHYDKGKKADCYRTKTVWVDFDKTKELPQFGKVCPDIIVKSGGGFHCYWLLESPIFIQNGRWREIEAVNRALAGKFKGDLMSIDASRILRVPGFNNHKYNPPRRIQASVLSD
jgi:hypothetical protein